MKKIITILFVSLVLQGYSQDKAKTKGKKTKEPSKIESKKVKDPKTIKTPSGLEYTITEKGNGKKPNKGDKISVHYTGKFTNDSVFDSSLRRGVPYELRLGNGEVIAGWEEAFLLLQEGDKATLRIPPALAYGDQTRGSIPANSTLIFDVELLKVTEGVKPFDVKGKDTLKTESGIKYIIVKENKTGESTKGKKVTINYSGFLREGRCFDSSVDRGQPLVAEVGRGKLFPGLDEAISLMRNGEKGKFIIPSQLAFGERGGGPIPPNSDLIMDLEVMNVQDIPVPVKFDTTGITPKTTVTGLKYFEIKKSGNEQKPMAGQNVKVHYSGYLTDGKLFDSSVERGEPIEFALGAGQVIAGWEEGIALMSVGDKYRLIIPSQLGYGEAGRAPVIPANAELIFDVELIAVSGNASPEAAPHEHSEGESHNH